MQIGSFSLARKAMNRSHSRMGSSPAIHKILAWYNPRAPFCAAKWEERNRVTHERWAQVRQIFDRAVESHDRGALLTEVCRGDDELRREVESLLAQHPGSGDPILDRSVCEVGGLFASDPSPDSTISLASGPTSIPAKIGRYRIVRLLGEGGMGSVYQAEQEQPRRLVALKLIKPGWANAETLRRFAQESEALGRLQHPGIAQIYEADTAETGSGPQPYFAMEFVRGRSLLSYADQCELVASQRLELMVKVCEAIDHAHQRGIIHRDLKPGNILVDENGNPKILDFGVARIHDSAFETNPQTSVGQLVGTLPYMSPEQLLADPAQLDTRSDIYALGVILYELLAGKRPYESDRKLLPEAMRSCAAGDALPLGSVNRSFSGDIEVIVQKALDKDRNCRYATAAMLAEDLKRYLRDEPIMARPSSPAYRLRKFVRRHRLLTLGWATAFLALVLGDLAFAWLLPKFPRPGQRRWTGVPDRQQSIAVLPFSDLSPEKNQEFFSDGLAEELLNELAKTPGLRVVGRTSSFQFKGKNEDGRAIGRKLNVETLLEGSVRRQGNRGRITMYLIRASDGFELWSEIYDRELSDIFAVEADIARAVTGALKVTVFRAGAVAAPPKTADPDAFAAYLQGRYFLARGDRKSFEQAVGYFRTAVKLDSALARGWLGLGECLSSQAGAGYIPQKDGLREAREAVERALTLDFNLGEAHSALGEIKMIFDWDWAGADESYKQALALDPGNASVLRGAAALKRYLGSLDEAIELQIRAIEIDPVYPRAYRNLGLMLHYAGRQEESRRALLKAQNLNPETALTHYYLSQILIAESHPQQALEEAEKEKFEDYRVLGKALACHNLGRNNESDANLAQLVASTDSYQVAEVYAFRGETDKAFESLQQAFRLRDPGLTEIKTDPLISTLRGDPRYKALLYKIGLPF
jgi:serine/threonine protein kinase